MSMCKPYRYFEWRAVFSVNMPEVRVFSTLRLFICLLWAVHLSSMTFLVLWRFILRKWRENKDKTSQMLKWFSLNLSFKHYTAKSLWKAHRDSAVLFYLKVLQTVGSHACVVFGAECGCVFVRDSDVTLPHLKWNVSVWFHASRRNLNVFSVLGYK